MDDRKMGNENADTVDVDSTFDDAGLDECSIVELEAISDVNGAIPDAQDDCQEVDPAYIHARNSAEAIEETYLVTEADDETYEESTRTEELLSPLAEYTYAMKAARTIREKALEAATEVLRAFQSDENIPATDEVLVLLIDSIEKAECTCEQILECANSEYRICMEAVRNIKDLVFNKLKPAIDALNEAEAGLAKIRKIADSEYDMLMHRADKVQNDAIIIARDVYQKAVWNAMTPPIIAVEKAEADAICEHEKAHESARAARNKSMEPASAVYEDAFENADAVYSECMEQVRSIYSSMPPARQEMWGLALRNEVERDSKTLKSANTDFEKSVSKAEAEYKNTEAEAAYRKARKEAAVALRLAAPEAYIDYCNAMKKAQSEYEKGGIAYTDNRDEYDEYDYYPEGTAAYENAIADLYSARVYGS